LGQSQFKFQAANAGQKWLKMRKFAFFIVFLLPVTAKTHIFKCEIDQVYKTACYLFTTPAVTSY